MLSYTLFACLCALLSLANAQGTSEPEDPNGEIYIRGGSVRFSHLSPLITYANPSVWNVTRDAAIAPPIRLEDPDAREDDWNDVKRFSWEYIGRNAQVTGVSEAVTYEAQPPLLSYDDVYGYFGAWNSSRDEGAPTTPPWTPYTMFRIDDRNDVYQWRNVSVIPRATRNAELNDVNWFAPMPIRQPYPRNLTDRTFITVQHAVNLGDNTSDSSDSTRNITFGARLGQDEGDGLAWNITSIVDLDEVDVNGTAIDPFTPNNTIADIVSPPGTYRNTIRNNFNTSHVLTSNVADQAALFHVPRKTSLIRIYGSVGPDMGLYNVVHWSDDPYHYLNRSMISPVYDAYRPIYATGQLLHVALVDPDAQWRIAINKVSPGGAETDDPDKRIELNGAVYMTFLEGPIGDSDSSYLEKANEATRARLAEQEGGGLSGGQIAGIVVGSVAGAALIGGLIFWLVRRRKRSRQANETRRGSEATWIDQDAPRKASSAV